MGDAVLIAAAAPPALLVAPVAAVANIMRFAAVVFACIDT
jgi:hypothetical protein